MPVIVLSHTKVQCRSISEILGDEFLIPEGLEELGELTCRTGPPALQISAGMVSELDSWLMAFTTLGCVYGVSRESLISSFGKRLNSLVIYRGRTV